MSEHHLRTAGGALTTGVHMTDTDSKDLSFLFPQLFALDQSVGDVNAELTRLLLVLDNAIGMAEKHAPNLPELPLLRERRQMIRRFQRAVFATSEYFQAELLSMEDGYARTSGLTTIL
jgi:hypothetical protein